MKTILRYTAAGILTLCASMILGAVLLILVYMLPTQEMKNNVQRSTAIYDYEDVYPQLMAGYKMSQLDNCTDATMLLNAIEPVRSYKDAMIVNRTEYYDRNPVGSLTDYANDVKKETYKATYPRYWHGYLIILKPLLLFFDVSDIRVFNMYIQAGLFICIILLMVKKGLKRCILPFIAAFMLLNPATLPLSFQFSTVSYIMYISSIIVLCKDKWSFGQTLFLFMMTGIATAYFDFLTFPLVGLYFPMIIMLMKEKSWKDAVKIVIAGSLAWIAGYSCMWAGKWLIGSLLTGVNLFKSSLSRADLYTSMKYNGAKITHLQIIFKNISVLLKYPVLFGGIGILIYYILNFIKSKKTHSTAFIECVPFIIIAFAPICWYMAAGTHSYIHYWFTYRELCVSVFAMLAGMDKITSLHN